MPTAVATFPRIVRFLGTSDSPGDSCPHCGAEGRYVIHFQTESGARGGAMRGCIKLFPTSRIALEELRLTDKQAKYAKQGWTLNRVDTRALEAIQAFYAGTMTESQALGAVDGAKMVNTARYRRR